MNKIVKYILLTSLLMGGIGLFSGTTEMLDSYASTEQAQVADTSTSVNRFPVKKTSVETFDDLNSKTPIDLKNPSNVKSEIEYDVKNNIYLFKTKIGEQEWVTPFSLTQKEYNDYSLQQSMARYFKIKNDEAFEKGDTKEDFQLKDIKINIGAAEKIFGPGGIKVRPQGYIELSLGLRHIANKNPSLSQNKSKMMLDVDQKIQLNVNASVGDKVNFDLNYDTEATFDFDSKKLKLAYEGKEDEILKYLEAGNVSLNTTNSLVSGATSLFGIRADMQFGKLRVNTVVSQQESESKSVNSKGGVQTTPFDFKADNYDENRHFFLGHYFRDNYDKAMSKLPFIESKVSITKMEVWVTNKRGNFEQARNVVAFADLAERDSIRNSRWTPNVAPNTPPGNNNNTLYGDIIREYPEARDKSQVTSTLPADVVNGLDYEKVESARLLSNNEYSYNAKLGYISLNYSLQSDEVLSVAYQYMINGKEYQVGEFASQITDKYNGDGKSGALFLKLLKPVSFSPEAYTWHLMMKNVYSLGAYQIQSDRFRLNISYQSDTTGTYINYIPEGNIENEMLLKVMNLDRLDSRQNQNPDGIFDFVEGYTVTSSNGRIIFPVVEPFGKHLRAKIGNDTIANKYVYEELYNLSLTDAKQIAEKNKFKISGSYKASANNEIDLGVANVARGSVRVTSGGVLLTEGVHYTVDYMSGRVKIIDESITSAGTPVSVSLENQTMSSMQRKTMLGMNLSYQLSKKIDFGATVLHMSEKPLTAKTGVGGESVSNTLLGFNAGYRTESQWLTNLVDKIPFVNATVPSQIAFTGEFAKMLPGHYQNKNAGGYSYLDDFETSRSKISLRDPYGWMLAATPTGLSFYDGTTDDTKLTVRDNIQYGMNRALLAWYTIDDLFTRKSSSLTPQHIKNDKEQLSNHHVRQVKIEELYPNREASYNESASIPILNLSFYPEERGPYNLDVAQVSTQGKLENPKKRWGAISRKIDSKDFEATNVEYIEFWMMDPFIYNGTGVEPDNTGGKLYFDLGEISEDILKDGKKFYENGLPLTKDPTLVELTQWGKVPLRQSTIYAFDAQNGARYIQDVGLNGLSTAEEREFQTYKDYLTGIRSTVTDDNTVAAWEADPFSPFNDPSGDNFHHFRGADYDREGKSILERYKYYNGTEGNSTGSDDNRTAKSSPDVEDLNQDYTLNETEAFYRYAVDLDPKKMEIGINKYITDVRELPVTLANDKTVPVKWYQFKIPIRDNSNYDLVGKPQGFSSIRYMRMAMQGFTQETHLRFGTLELVRGDWRTYTQALNDLPASPNTTISVTSVNIEENGKKEPVNYILPPGESRVLDPSQPQIRQDNEQSLAIQIQDLSPEDARAVYKSSSYDLRRYKRLQMFTHAESIPLEDEVQKGELTVFLRLGSDYKNNYYEYEIPLTITPPGKYNENSNADRLIVWPSENMFDFPLDLLKDVKVNRNKKKRIANSPVTFTKLYHEYDPQKPNNKVSVIGNPSLSEINVIMIGVRNNNVKHVRSGEIWVDELRMTDFDEKGGWAAQGNLSVALSDLANVNLAGRKETVGFGTIDQSLMERRADDFYTYSLSANINAGKFLPEKIKANIPIYYSYSNETTTPNYDPLDQDVLLSESLSSVNTKAEKDSIKNLAQEKMTSKSFSISGAKLGIQSKTPMPYDPANISLTYAQNIMESSNPTTVYDQTKDHKANLAYSYSPMMKTWEPFKESKSKAPMAKFTKGLGFNYLPNNIAFNSNMTRHYTETMIRDLESYTLGGNNDGNNFLSHSSNFYWDRDFSIAWDFTKNLKVSVQTGTKAEIEEPHLQVNKKLNPDHYEIWKDSVIRSIKNMGRPLTFRQTASATYNVPFSTIPFADWINTTLAYNSDYSWDRGASMDADTEVGNTIQNSATYTINNRFNMLTLYNKSAFLKKVNQKFTQSSIRNSNASRVKPQREKKVKRFEKNVTLNTDSATIIVHSLNTKNIRVTARSADSTRTYSVKFKKLDNNSIRITNKDTVGIKVSIMPGDDAEETMWYKIAEYSARGMMSLRTLSINYSRRDETHIYGFRPNVGDFFGQNASISPGLGFAFGIEGGEDYLEKSYDKEWLVLNEYNVNPAIFNKSEKLDIKAQLEPIKGLKIDLNAIHEKNDRTESRIFSNAGNMDRVRTFGGSFSMTTFSLSSAFESFNEQKEYQSNTFDKFLANRQIITDRLENKYAGASFPNGGTYQGNGVNKNSSDVLIPAFLAAYTGKKADKISLSPFPSISSMIPNWNITYDGLIALPWIKDKFKTIKLMHGYTSRYQVGSFSSFSTWSANSEGLGFIGNPLDQSAQPMPSSPYDISTVSIIEQFNPLFGAEGTLNNSMTLRARYNKNRSLNLNMSSYQIVESRQNEFVLGMGYRINNFNRLIGLTSKAQKGFNNDLNLTADLSHKTTQALLRKIEENYSQATSGTTVFTIKMSADYALSKSLTLRAFFDRVLNKPLISASAYPTTTTNFGLSIRFTLTQ